MSTGWVRTICGGAVTVGLVLPLGNSVGAQDVTRSAGPASRSAAVQTGANTPAAVALPAETAAATMSIAQSGVPRIAGPLDDDDGPGGDRLQGGEVPPFAPQAPVPPGMQGEPGMSGAPAAPYGLAPRGPALAPIGPPVQPVPGPPPRLRDYSWIYIDAPMPRKVAVHDIITVIVDEKSEVTQDSRFNRQRNALMKAELKEFIRIGDSGNLRPAALDAPSIDAQLRSQLNTTGQARSREGMRYRIAATVVDVLPNGTLILEARKSIRTNGELWEYSLTGRIRSEDVGANNTVLSENIANLDISKREHGKIYDSTKRGFVTRIYDFFLPF